MLHPSPESFIDPAQIVDRIRAGDRSAETALVREYRSKVIDMLRWLSGDPSRAEDFAHETLIIIIEKLRKERLDDPYRLTTYILNTAKYHFIGWTRRHGNQVSSLPDCDHVEDECEDQAAMYAREQDRELLVRSIDAMGARRDRDILKRYYLYEQDKIQVCEALDMDCDHFDKVISRARGRLRTLVHAEATAMA